VILVDSDVLIQHLRGDPHATEWLRAAYRADPIAVSVISVVELAGGMRSAERREVWGLLAITRVLPATEAIARRAGELMRTYRRSHQGIGLGDYLIAATAIEHGCDLATLNTRHFPMFPDLQPPFRTMTN